MAMPEPAMLNMRDGRSKDGKWFGNDMPLDTKAASKLLVNAS
jgi:hypothetical protein